MKILITGGLGHIGSAITRDLIEKSWVEHIYIIDDLSTQRFCSLFGLDLSHVSFIEGDVRDPATLESAHDANVVIHLAATTNAEQSFYDPEAIEANNLGSTKAVGLWADSRGKNLIHLSSTSVYGHSGSLVTEDEPAHCNPQSPYAVIKLQEERFLKEQLGNNFLSLRFGTIYGISPGMRFHTAVNKFCFQAAFGIPLAIWRTSLDQVRPYLHLDDACSFIEHVLRNNAFTGETYNVLSGNHCVRDILDEIRSHKPDITTNIVDSPIMNQLSYEVSLEKVARLGWRPTQIGLDLSPYFETLFLSTRGRT